MKMRPAALFLTLSAALLAPAVSASAQSAAKVSAETSNDSDVLFMAAASMSNLTEIVTSKMALQKSQSADVRAYAQRMISEHTQAQNELAALATKKNVDIPNKPGADQRVMGNKLMALTGKAFDAEYKKVQVMSHQAPLGVIQSYLDIGKDSEVTNYAAKIQPAVEMHLVDAKKLSVQ